MVKNSILNHWKKILKTKQYLKETKYSEEQIDSIQKGTIVDWANDSRKYLDKIYNIENHKVSLEYAESKYKTIKIKHILLEFVLLVFLKKLSGVKIRAQL